MPENANDDGLGRREFLVVGAATVVAACAGGGQGRREASAASAPGEPMDITLVVNGERRSLRIDPRTTLLDLLRENLGLTGTKKGCDMGQCGACTVLLDGRRAHACLALAVAHDGAELTTVEGLAAGDDLHPLQAAFIEHDAFQCGYCTPGQICSAVGMLAEARDGWPSAVTGDLSATDPVLDDGEIRERMSG